MFEIMEEERRGRLLSQASAPTRPLVAACAKTARPAGLTWPRFERARAGRNIPKSAGISGSIKSGGRREEKRGMDLVPVV